MEEKELHGRVRNHHAELGESRRDRGRDADQGLPVLRGLCGLDDPLRPRREHDRPGDGTERPKARRRKARDATRARFVGDHDGEGLLASALSRAQPGDGLLVSCIADEVEAPEPLHGDDAAGEDLLERGANGVSRKQAPGGVRRKELRPAHGAGVGLGVKAPVGGIIILGLALAAHREVPHRGLRAVVGDAERDREARPAVRAVRERIAPAAVLGIEHVAHAFGAGRGVGRHHRVRHAVAALGDREVLRPLGGEEAEREELVDPREGRLAGDVPAKRLREGRDRGLLALNDGDDALGVVPDAAAEPEPTGRSPDGRAEADPLDEAPDAMGLTNAHCLPPFRFAFLLFFRRVRAKRASSPR